MQVALALALPTYLNALQDLRLEGRTEAFHRLQLILLRGFLELIER